LGLVELFYEDTVSRTGGHRAVAIALVVSKQGVVDARKVEGTRLQSEGRGVYSRGKRLVYSVPLRPGELAVQLLLVRNTRGWVKGWLSVIDHNGEEVYRAVIRELKARYSKGDPSYAWAAEAALRHLGLHKKLRRVNLAGRGSGGAGQGG
jgi:hypothetical protein